MAEALYRKYRPQVFEDVVGQEHIERTIKNAIAADKVSHAYLFTGPRGTGKTTTARLLAKALLCEKGPTAEPDGTCDQCTQIAEGSHPDVYELDAASRTGVENVREEIIGRVSYAPTRGRYKVYIIDEVHMLSTAAFNALLKTLEEPPDHVVFIMCTTDPHKVLETIQSRCQRFDFRRISNEEIVSRLGAICLEEGIEFEGDALELVASRAEGGMRDALTSLEQLITFGEGRVTMEAAERMLGALDSTDLAEIVRAIGERDVAACFRWTADYLETGADLAQFTHDLAERVRSMYVLTLSEGHGELAADLGETARRELAEELPLFGPDRLARMMGVLGDLTAELRVTTNPRLSFEIALTRMVRPQSDLTLESLAERIEAMETRLAAGVGAAAGAAAAVPRAEAPAQAGQAGAEAAVALGDPSSEASLPAQGGSGASSGAPQEVASGAARTLGTADAAASIPGSGPSAVAMEAQAVPAPTAAGEGAAAVAARQAVSSTPLGAAPSSGVQPEGAGGFGGAVQQPEATPVAQQAAQRAAEPVPAATPESSAGTAQQPGEPSAQAPAERSAAGSGAAATGDGAPSAAAMPSADGAAASTGAPAGPLPESLAAELQNPAALQRIWQQILTVLKQKAAAHGVLFLGTKAVFDVAGGSLQVAFPAENEFAFATANKPNVQEELRDAVQQVCGAALPVLLTRGGEAGAPAAAVAAQPTAAAQPVVTEQADRTLPQQPAASAQAQPEPVRAAQPQPQAEPAPAMGQLGGTPADRGPAAASGMALQEQPADRVEGAPSAAAGPASAQPAQASATAQADFVPYDEVPLDVYDDIAPWEDAPAAEPFEPAVASSASDSTAARSAASGRPAVAAQASAPAQPIAAAQPASTQPAVAAEPAAVSEPTAAASQPAVSAEPTASAQTIAPSSAAQPATGPSLAAEASAGAGPAASGASAVPVPGADNDIDAALAAAFGEEAFFTEVTEA